MVACGIFAASPAANAQVATESKTETSAESIKALAQDLHCYAFPIVLMEITRQQTTNVPDGTSAPGRAPINQFAHYRNYPKADAKEVVRINFDTLYSSAWLDLSQEPIILTVPDTGGRYYLVPTLDMWTDVFCSLGSRTTGTKAGHYAYVAPGWTGTLPDNVVKIQAPTSMIWMLERTQTNGPSDYENVHKVQNGLKFTPLSQWGKEEAPVSKAGTVDPKIDDKTPPLEQASKLSGVEIFQQLAELLKKYPPHPNDYPILLRARAIGLEPGKSWDSSMLDAATIEAINEGSKQGMANIVKRIKTMGTKVNGWNIAVDNMGCYGTSYLQRAAIALAGLGANLPEDAIYPTAFLDSEGKPLDAANKYVLHFDKDKLPPANAFWSITMYDNEGFQVPNPINRFAIGDRDKLKLNDDGSLDLYIQTESPGKEKESNWLPAPKSGAMGPTMRIYSPRAEALNGTWTPPALKKVE